MSKQKIICVDDQPEVLSALLKDLDIFNEHFDILECDSGLDAYELLTDLNDDGESIALIISDHIMPKMSGVEFLTKVQEEGGFSSTKKLLLTGLATQEDTITAINRAKVEHYISKPWTKENLVKTVQSLLTEYIFDKGLDYTQFGTNLDSDVIIKRLR